MKKCTVVLASAAAIMFAGVASANAEQIERRIITVTHKKTTVRERIVPVADYVPSYYEATEDCPPEALLPPKVVEVGPGYRQSIYVPEPVKKVTYKSYPADVTYWTDSKYYPSGQTQYIIGSNDPRWGQWERPDSHATAYFKATRAPVAYYANPETGGYAGGYAYRPVVRKGYDAYSAW